MRLCAQTHGGGLLCTIYRESLSGNAGTADDKPCLGANFSFDRIMGEIVYFGNLDELLPNIREDYQRGNLRISLDLHGTGTVRILNYEADFLEPEAWRTIETTIEQFNKNTT